MVQRMLVHAVAIAALGAMCVAQTSAGSSTGDASSMEQGQQQSGSMNQGYGSSSRNSPSSMSGNTGTSTTASSSTGQKSPDAAFIKKAAQGGLAEVQLGQLATQNGESEAVKQFGNRMVTDHSQANNELQQIARDKGIVVPTSLNPTDKQEMKQLESKRGATFDKTYARNMVKDHEKDVAEFRREAQNGKDPEVKAWAQKTLPTLEEHLSLARQMQSQVASGPAKAPGAMSSPQGAQGSSKSSPHGSQHY